MKLTTVQIKQIKPEDSTRRYFDGGGLYLEVRPMSDNTANAALRRMGYSKDEMTAHGFRAMASTLLNEAGYDPDAIEKQLAHVEANKVRAAYHRAHTWRSESG